MDDDLKPDETQPMRVRDSVMFLVKAVRKYGQRAISAAAAKLIFEAVIELMITETVKKGYFRLPGGFGALQLRKVGSDGGPPQILRGVEVPRKSVFVIRYVEGTATRELLGKAPKVPYQRQRPRTHHLDAIDAVIENIPSTDPTEPGV